MVSETRLTLRWAITASLLHWFASGQRSWGDAEWSLSVFGAWLWADDRVNAVLGYVAGLGR